MVRKNCNIGTSHSHHDVHNSLQRFNRAFIIAIVANGMFVTVQIIFAFMMNSTSLLADAVHNLGDVLSLGLAWVANCLVKRSPTERTSYGMKKSTILAAFINGMILIFTCGIIATEAAYKFFSPSPVHALGVMVVASIGILVNGLTAGLFITGRDDLNIRGAFLHLLYDALISAGVVISAFLLYLTGWLWLDPLVGLMIAGIIFKGTWTLFQDSFRMMIDGVPRGISMNQVRQVLMQQEGVHGVHDLHIWALSTQENALSAHLYMPDVSMGDKVRQSLCQILKSQFRIHHVTLQIERDIRYCEDDCNDYL